MKAHPSKTIIRPRITEKAALKNETESVYVFEVAKSSTKPTIKNAVKAFWGVTPVKVNITKLPSKTTFKRGKKGSVPAIVKAYVYLKKGEKIELS